MSVFADSSALVKLYADEEHADLARALETIVVSALARVEVPAALWRKHRLGQLDAEDAGILGEAFRADYHGTESDPPRFATVPVVGDVLERAAALVATSDLRAYDAVQLASALAAREADEECATFACFDAGLRAAAATHGLVLLPS